MPSKERISNAPPSDYSDHGGLWVNHSSSVSSIGSSPWDVSKLEVYLSYFGIRGIRCLGPKLIYQTSKDVFNAPSGARARSSSHAASACLRARQTWQGQSVGCYSFSGS